MKGGIQENVCVTVGQTTISENQIHWEIPNFFDKMQSVHTLISSCAFTPDSKLFSFSLKPHAITYNPTDGVFRILTYGNLSESKKLQVRVGITDSQGKELHSSYLKWDYKNSWFKDSILRSELESQRDSTIDDSSIRIICTFTEEPAVEACHQKVQERALEKLSQSLEELYRGKKDCDLKIRVKGREFLAHRGILRARTLVFDAMLSHEMVERNDGVISIEDCTPEVFEYFLLFLYAGKCENLPGSNACGLYHMADKYDLPELREMCVQFLKGSLSKEIITDVINLASNHNEVELLELATEFFATNTEEILSTTSWQLLMKDNPAQATEFTVKALNLGYTKKRRLC